MCTSCRCGDQKCPSCGDNKINLEKNYREEQTEQLDWLDSFFEVEDWMYYEQALDFYREESL